MNEIQRYLAEEIALDCNAGHITQTEALRRLHVMGLSMAVAAALITACGGNDSNTAPTGTTVTGTEQPGNQQPGSGGSGGTSGATGTVSSGGASSTTATPTAATPAESETPGATVASAQATEAITFAGPNGTLQGAFAAPANPRGAVLVIHENRGLNDHTRTIAGRLATAGYAAIALDLLSEEGGTGSFADTAAATAALGQVDPSRFVADMRAALDELERRAPGAKLGAIGFCFGGGMMWRLLAAEPRMAAVSPFYGALPTDSNFAQSQAAVLAFYGENDARINMSRDAAGTALTAASLTHELVTQPGANHAFFNDTGMNYNPAAATDAWTRLIAFFRSNLG
jgi:carboxymethylenebutenolidase